MENGPTLHFLYKNDEKYKDTWTKVQPLTEKAMNFFNKNISNVHFGAGVHRCPGKDVSQFVFPKIFNAVTEQLKYSTLNSADILFEENEMTKRIISMPIHVMQTIETL